MKALIRTPFGVVKPGMRILIEKMDNTGGRDWQADEYNGKSGTVRFIDDEGYIHGDWGGLSVNPQIDKFKII